MGTELPTPSTRQTTSSLSKEYLPKLPSLNQLSTEVYMRLEQNWRYTGQNYKNGDREHIRFFINLCKKEGRGDSPMKTSLFEVFTVQLAEQIEKELLSFYGF